MPKYRSKTKKPAGSYEKGKKEIEQTASKEDKGETSKREDEHNDIVDSVANEQGEDIYCDMCTDSIKSVPRTAPPKKELSESDKKALSAAVFDTSDKELSFRDDNSDLFTGASPATSKAQTSNKTPATVTASKPRRMPNPLFDDDEDKLDWLS